jgi:hypothetical protein
MRGSRFDPSDPVAWAHRQALYLDRLFKSTVLGTASLVPGVPGIVAACGAVAFDVSHQFWIGGLLSGLSMIPLVGYVPGAGKIAWTLCLLNDEIRALEELLPTIQSSSEVIDPIRAVIHRYYDKMAKINTTLPIMKRMRSILDAGEPMRRA